MARLPTPGSDEGAWGTLLNEYLSISHDGDGTIKANAVDSSALQPNSISGVKLQDSSITNAKLATGTGADGNVLTKDSLASGGFSWSAPATGAPAATAVSLGTIQLAGDIGGTATAPTVPGLTGKQPLDSDLTAVAALTPTNDDIIQRKAGTWTNRTPAQVKTDLALAKADVGLGNVDNTSDAAKPISTATQTALDAKAADSATVHKTGAETIAGVKTFSSSPIVPTPTNGTDAVNKTYVDGVGTSSQPLDSDLTAIAALTPTNDDLIQRKAGAWVNRTPAQVKTDLALAKADVGLGNVDNTSDANKPVSTATQTALNLKESTANKGVASGYAGLDSGIHVPVAQLGSGTATTGTYLRGDGAWTAAPVTSVATRTGAITLGEADITNLTTDLANRTTVANGGGETYFDAGNSGTAVTLSLANGNVQKLTLTNTCTITLTSPAAGAYRSLLLYVFQDGTGTRTVTWPGSVRWGNAGVPVLSTAASKMDKILLDTVDGGVTWFGAAGPGGY